MFAIIMRRAFEPASIAAILCITAILLFEERRRRAEAVLGHARARRSMCPMAVVSVQFRTAPADRTTFVYLRRR
jgi:hypothetical protein